MNLQLAHVRMVKMESNILNIIRTNMHTNIHIKIRSKKQSGYFTYLNTPSFPSPKSTVLKDKKDTTKEKETFTHSHIVSFAHQMIQKKDSLLVNANKKARGQHTSINHVFHSTFLH